MPYPKLSPHTSTLVQLELDFGAAISTALAEPEQADLSHLWRSAESLLAQMAQADQLKFAGKVILELAEVCEQRALNIWEDWQEQHNQGGRFWEMIFLTGMTRDSMFLDLSKVLKPLKDRQQAATPEGEPETMCEAVTKEEALRLAAEVEAARAAIERLAYDENVGEWANVIRSWLMQQGESSAPLLQIQHQTGLAIVQVWLAGMLNGMKLEQQGEFYEAGGVRVGMILEEA
jgi:hypothetical protein